MGTDFGTLQHDGADEPTGSTTARPPSMRRRLAAAVALLAFALAVVVVLTALVRDPLRLAGGLILLVLAVLAAWSALVQRGLLRVLGTVVALAALAGLLVLLDVRSFLRIALVVVLVVISAGATRAAVGRDLVDAPRMRRVPAGARGVLIMNPWSGGGAVERHGLVAAARERGVRPILLQRGDDLRALAEDAVAAGADVIGMAGGDGSQALVADVARQHGVAFVCVPAGTRNHFALDLGLDRVHVGNALDAYGEAHERLVDLAVIGDRVFVNNASLGVYATVVQSDAYRGAKLATIVRMLPDLVGPRSSGFDLQFDLPDGTHRDTADLVLISNNVYRLHGSGGSGTRPRLDEGVLGILAATVERAHDDGGGSEAASGREMRVWSTRTFVVDSAEPLVEVGVDGEALQLEPPLEFRSLPAALRVRVPLDAAGASPAAMRPDGVGAAVRAVFRVLRGQPAAAAPAARSDAAESDGGGAGAHRSTG